MEEDEQIPDHVSDILEQVTEETEETEDELVAQVSALENSNAERHTELLERISTCQNRLDTLSERSSQTPESPMLVQIVSQLTELQKELTALKLSQDLKRNLPNREPSELILTETPSSAPSQEKSTEELSAESVTVENPVEKPARKRIFV